VLILALRVFDIRKTVVYFLCAVEISGVYRIDDTGGCFDKLPAIKCRWLEVAENVAPFLGNVFRAMKAKEVMPILNQSDFARLAGGTIPFIRKYSTICP
jgi:hypothetical protein